MHVYMNRNQKPGCNGLVLSAFFGKLVERKPCSMKKTLTLLLSLVAFALQAIGQIPVYRTSGRIAGTGADYGDFLLTDSNGNLYVAGRFAGTCDMDPGPGIANLISTGASDIFIAKYSPTGAYIWAFNIGGTGTDRPMTFKMDPSGNLVLAGDFSTSVDFDPGPSTTTLTSNGGADIFVAKYDQSGQLLLAFNVGGPNTDYAESIAFDSNGDFILVGEFASPTIDMDPGTGTLTLNNFNPSGISYDAYVARFDNTGTLLWAFNLLGTSSDYLKSVVIDNAGRIITGGYFTGSLVTDPVGGASVTSSGGTDCFIARYSSAGVYDNSWSFGGGGTDNLFALATFNGNIYSTGTFNSTADLAPGPDTAFVSSRGLTDVFLNAISPSGSLLWAGGFGGTGTDNSSHLMMNASGDLYVSGSFVDSADFELGSGIQSVTSYGGRDGFYAKYNSTGNLIWTLKVGSNLIDYARGMAFAPDGELWCTGYYGNANLYLDPMNLATTLSSVGSNDAFFARYGECSYPVYTAQPNNGGACPGGNSSFSIQASGQNPTYQWQEGTSGGTVWTNITNGGVYSGATTPSLSLTGVTTAFNNRFYRCVVSVECGLSSISGVGILFVGAPDTSVTVNGITLSGVNTAGATYQWLNCNNNFAPISGATSATFTPTANGSYALQITRNGCTDTSSCYTVSSVGIEEAPSPGMSIFPVPTRDRVQVRMELPGNYLVSLADLSGRIVSAQQRFSREVEVNVEQLGQGAYILTVRNEYGKEWSRRIVKE